MASISVAPSTISKGEQISITGEGFEPSAVVTVKIPELGISSEIVADAAGFFGSDDVADEEVVLDSVTYVWKAAPTTTANEVKVGATAGNALANLKAAINLAAGSGSLYGSGNALASTVTMTNGSFAGATFVDTGSAATGVSALVHAPEKPGTYEVEATDGTNSAETTFQVWS